MNERKRRRKERGLVRLTRLRDQLARDTDEAHKSNAYQRALLPILREIEPRYRSTCDACSGAGVVQDPEDGSPMTCPECGGFGIMTDSLAMDVDGTLEEAWEQARRRSLEKVECQIAELSRGIA